MIQRPLRLALVVGVLWLTAPVAAGAATFGHDTPSCDEVQFYADGVAWADLHYTVNGGDQRNVRMAQSGTRATYTVGALTRGASLRFFFTYVDAGRSGAVDSPWDTMTVSCGADASAYVLRVARDGAGTGTVTSSPPGIQCGTACSAHYASGTAVTLTAIPASGSIFTGWSGACAGTDPCVTTMTAARIVTATFRATGRGDTTRGDACETCIYHRLVWSDEFEGAGQPSASNWNYHVGNGANAGAFTGWGNGEWEWYRPSDCYQEGGNLVLRAQWLPRPLAIAGRSWYQTSCRITSQGKRAFARARVEARIAMPSAPGTWPAFWMMGSSYDGSYTSRYDPAVGAHDEMATNWASCGEIDIMEHQNTDAIIYNNLFWDTRTGLLPWSGPNVGTNPSTAHVGDVTRFHTYTLEWNDSVMYWYVDHVRVKTQSISASTMEEYRQSFFILLNLALGGAFPGRDPAQGSFPMYMYVDYVRVYQ